MKIGFLSALVLLGMAASASANCSTASLAGTWVSFKDTGPCTATISAAGVMTGTCGSGTLAMTAACKFSGTVGGKPVSGRSEAIAAASALKPNLLLGLVGTIGAGSEMFAYRK